MSAEHFETLMHVDVRTAEDGRSCEWALPGSGYPRLVDNWDGDRSRSWITTTPYAHDAILIAAKAVATQPMDGITGDHADKRAQIVEVMEAVASAVRALACDDAYDGKMTDGGWEVYLQRITMAAVSRTESKPSREGGAEPEGSGPFGF